LFGNSGSRNKTTFSKFRNLKILRVLPYKIWRLGLLRIVAKWKVFTRPTCALDFFKATPKKIASVGAANQVFVVVAKYTGTAPTASASEKLAARTVTHI
jgi:phosphoglucomutase